MPPPALRQFDGAPAIQPRTFDLNTAARDEIRMKLGIDGPSGSGKTLGGLLLCFGLVQSALPEVATTAATGSPEEREAAAALLWSKVVVLDTENRSALAYRGRNLATPEGDVRIGKFIHVPFDPPYDPRYWIAALDTIEESGAIACLIDSTTHEWTGRGGCLDLQRELGGRAQDWATVSPMHQAFIDRIRLANMHVCCAIRTKQEYSITSTEEGGRKKTTVEKLGMKPEQREGFEYELGIVFSVAHRDHMSSAGKDRTGLFANQAPHLITPETGRTIGDWCKGGVSAIGSAEWLAQRLTDLAGCATMAGLQQLFTKVYRQGAGLLTETDKTHLLKVKDDAKARLMAAAQAAPSP